MASGLPSQLKRKLLMSPSTGCWEWTAHRDKDGYGRVTFRGRRGHAHRAVYEVLRGEIAAGLQLDHLCRNRCCCNPDHLEPVTCAENIARGLTGKHQLAIRRCPRGHEYSAENTFIANGSRQCRQCGRDRVREYARRPEVKVSRREYGREYMRRRRAAQKEQAHG